MLIDGLEFSQTSAASSLRASSGTSFPTGPQDGDFFRLTAASGGKDEGLYFYDAVKSDWITGDVTSVTASTGLTGGGNSGALTLALDEAYMQLHYAALTGGKISVTQLPQLSYSGLSGAPTAISAFTNDSGFQNASQVSAAIQSVVGAAPAALDTLAEIATQLASDESAAAALVNTVSLKADTSAISTVGFSGSYNDLLNKPSAYSLPTASTSTLGGVKVDGTTITITNGVISGANTYTLPTATASRLGGVKAGTNVTIAADGTISAAGNVTSVNGQAGDVVLNFTNLGSYTGMPYHITCGVSGQLDGGETISRWLAPVSFTIPADFAGSFCSSLTAPTADCQFIVQKAGVQVGTINFTAGFVNATFSTQAAITWAAGERFSIVAPATADLTLADVDFAFVAALA